MNGQKARLFASGNPLQARIMFQVTPELTSMKISRSVCNKFSPARLILAKLVEPTRVRHLLGQTLTCKFKLGSKGSSCRNTLAYFDTESLTEKKSCIRLIPYDQGRML